MDIRWNSQLHLNIPKCRPLEGGDDIWESSLKSLAANNKYLCSLFIFNFFLSFPKRLNLILLKNIKLTYFLKNLILKSMLLKDISDLFHNIVPTTNLIPFSPAISSW